MHRKKLARFEFDYSFKTLSNRSVLNFTSNKRHLKMAGIKDEASLMQKMEAIFGGKENFSVRLLKKERV